jgi:hypothetical protein
MTEETAMETKSDVYLANGGFGDLNAYLRDVGTIYDWRACTINTSVTARVTNVCSSSGQARQAG